MRGRKAAGVESGSSKEEGSFTSVLQGIAAIESLSSSEADALLYT